MPNWTHCKIEAPNEVLKKYITKDSEGKAEFDFNLLIPMPKEYLEKDMSEGFDTDYCIYWYLSNRGTTMIHGIEKGLIPYSGVLDMDRSRMMDYCLEHSDECYQRGQKYYDLYKKYGHRSWYYWAIENWGTKWNAVDTLVDGDLDDFESVEFDVEWCYPEPIVKKLFEENPGCRIGFFWSDEDYDGDHGIERDENGRFNHWHQWNDEEDKEDDEE